VNGEISSNVVSKCVPGVVEGDFAVHHILAGERSFAASADGERHRLAAADRVEHDDLGRPGLGEASAR
jgi:hypothetical protein